MTIAFAYLYPATKSQETNQTNYRLPTYIIPTRYDIHLIISKFKTEWNASNAFKGQINIIFTTTEEKAKQDPIILNSKNLSIQEVKLDNAPLSITEYAIFDKFERLVINNTIKDNHNHTLTLKYEGKIHPDMTGLFSNFYQQGDSNITRAFWYIATQMAPVYARSVFPCLDEPTFKARVKLRVSYPNIFKVALSNTEGTTSSDNNLTTTTFKETPRMSTYLIGFVLCEENFTLARFTIAGVPYKIRFRPQFKKLAYKYPLFLSLNIVDEYEEITGIPYMEGENEGIRKVEQVAMPHFLQRTKGNWGLILYREPMFLWDEEQSSTEAKQIVATNIARKLGQMWFENLKTPAWWNTAWISEGFATFYQFEILAKIECDWEMENQLVAETFLKAMHFDYPSGRPLSLPEASVLDSHSIVATADRTFDVVIPFKGAAILRMMRMLMGKDLFNKGIKKFLSKQRPDIVTPQYFWDSWEKSDLTNNFPKPVNEIMEGWIKRAGFPIVFVSSEDHNHRKIDISAKGLYDPLNKTMLDNVWCIPLTYTTYKDPNFEDTVPKLWLTNSSKVILDIDMNPNEAWMVANLQYSAYMRVNYGNRMWFQLRKALGLNPKTLPVLYRIQLIDDVMTMALVEEVHYARLIYTLRYLKYETNYWPWYTALKNFETQKQWLEDGEITAINAFLRSLFDNFYQSVNDDFGVSSLKKALVWKAACEMKDDYCLKEMTRIFKEFTDSGVEVEPDLRFVVYCTGLRSKDGIQFWDTLYARMIESNVPSEDGVITQALGCTEDLNILKRYLGKFLDKNSPLNPYNSEDVKKILSAVITNSRSGSEALMVFLEENAKYILMYPGLIQQSISSLASSIRNEKQLKMMQNLADMPEMRSYGLLFSKYTALGKKTLKWSQNLRKRLTEGFNVEKTWNKLERKASTGIITAATKTFLLFLIAAFFRVF